MADKNKTESATATETPEAPTYHVDRLIAEADEFFGQPSHVVAGALDDEQKKNFSRDEAEQAIKNWLRKEITTEA